MRAPRRRRSPQSQCPVRRKILRERSAASAAHRSSEAALKKLEQLFDSPLGYAVSLVQEDTDGDGKADVAKTFYQGNDVNAALGICVLGTKVIVSCSPKILVFTDENGDDKADGPPQVVFNGIGGVDHDHGAHAFVFGPDGKLYFNIGNDDLA
mgnify:CR=1 FL=1